MEQIAKESQTEIVTKDAFESTREVESIEVRAPMAALLMQGNC